MDVSKPIELSSKRLPGRTRGRIRPLLGIANRKVMKALESRVNVVCSQMPRGTAS